MSRRTLPVSVDVGSKTYEIDSDFRTIMDIEDILFRSELTEEQKAFAEEMESCSDIEHGDACQNARYFDAMKVFYKDNIPEDLPEAMEQMLWFYSCGKEEKGKAPKKPVLSFKYDFDYINAGFMQDYKIDLFEIDYLHWWKFMSLFGALHDDCKICEIIGWRGAELRDYKDKEQKKRIREMQKIYALPDERSDEEKKKQDEIIAALMGDGDLSNIL